MMPRQSIEGRQTATQTGVPVGRCCQRDVITGQVITDWHPLRGNTELINKCYSQYKQHSSPREPVRRRPWRRTVSYASDNIPVQSTLLCAGTRHVSDKYKCNLRFIFGTGDSSKRSETGALALPQLGGREYPAKLHRATVDLPPPRAPLKRTWISLCRLSSY